jgi:hypothetical protein
VLIHEKTHEAHVPFREVDGPLQFIRISHAEILPWRDVGFHLTDDSRWH